MEKNRRFTVGINVGTASLVLILSVLVLSVFAVLTLVSSENEKKLAEKHADTIRGYYAADCVGEETLARIRELAAQGGPGAVQSALPDGVRAVIKEGRLYIAFKTAIDNNRAISVVAVIENGLVDVLSKQVVSLGDWNPNDRLNVWTGE